MTDSVAARVLVATDDPAARKAVRKCLAADGHEVAEAADGEAALTLLASFRPDLLVLDAEMPKLDGFLTCRRLRSLKDWATVPVLLLTDQADHRAIARAFSVGASDFDIKPVQPLIMQQRVRFLIRAARESQELEATLVAIRENERRLTNAQRIARIGSWEHLPGAAFVAISQGFREVVGRPLMPDEVETREVARLIAPRHRGTFDHALRDVAEKGERRAIEHQILLPNGLERWVSHEILRVDSPDGPLLFGLVQDMTERKAAEQEIERLAFYDGLTGLANRPLMQQHLGRSLDYAARSDRSLAVLFLDLDRFKSVNDTHGHACGDEVLSEVAQRLVDSVRSRDRVGRSGMGASVSRIGGDEFIVVLSEMAEAGDAAIVAKRLTKALEEPIMAEGHKIRMTASIGIAVAPADGTDAEALLANADAAMYECKRRGGKGFEFYNVTLGDRLRRAVTLERRLAIALETGALEQVYQPIIDSETEEIIKIEALARWNDAELGVIEPGEFIAVAEKTGQILELGKAAIRLACQQHVHWRLQTGRQVTVTVNVSPVQLCDAGFPDTVAGILEETGVPGRYLDLEIAEGTFIQTDPAVDAVLQRLRSSGVGLFVDGYGTGFSSLRYLQRMQVDGLKIDRAFVENVDDTRSGAPLVAAMISMGHRLGLVTVAQGVETHQQREFLRSEGCHLLQGYLFSRPVPADEILARLAAEGSAESRA